MKTAIKVLLISVLVALLSLLAVGCDEEASQSSGDARSAQDYSAKQQAQPAQKESQEAGKKESETAVKSSRSVGRMVPLTLYFSDEQAEHLVPEVRQVEDTAAIAKVAVEELVKGPKEDGLHATIPSETKVLNVDIIKNVAYVNFSKDLIDKHWGGSTGELMTITSLVDTLTEFKNIQKVQIMVEGKVVDTIAGHADTSRPFARDESMIKKK
ncbi:MAG: GerMN domain-containing protein [Candidatus Aquicultor sp.]